MLQRFVSIIVVELLTDLRIASNHSFIYFSFVFVRTIFDNSGVKNWKREKKKEIILISWLSWCMKSHGLWIKTHRHIYICCTFKGSERHCVQVGKASARTHTITHYSHIHRKAAKTQYTNELLRTMLPRTMMSSTICHFFRYSFPQYSVASALSLRHKNISNHIWNDEIKSFSKAHLIELIPNAQMFCCFSCSKNWWKIIENIHSNFFSISNVDSTISNNNRTTNL